MRPDADPRRLLGTASAFRQAGKYAEAEEAYRRLLALSPDLPDCWYNLAWTQRQLGRFSSALESYAQALARGVRVPEEVHLNRGVIFADHLRNERAAEAEYEAALRLNPQFAPALLNLANLHEDNGERELARNMYERILARDPKASDALARLASLSRITNPDDPMIARLESVHGDGRIDPASRANLAFALGRALDAAGCYDRALKAYDNANVISRAVARRAGVKPYDRTGHESFIDRIIAAFPRADAPSQDEAGQSPIFICGMFRSGSTLVEQVLAGHPRITPGGELDLLPSLVRGALAPFPESMIPKTRVELARMAADYRQMLARLFPSADRITDKRPDNFLYIGMIKRLFPKARIIHTTRQPLDNILSVYFLNLDHAMAYAHDLADIAHYYSQYRRLMSHWRALYGQDICDFSYDDFVAAPVPAAKRLLEFLSLDWHEECLAVDRRTNPVKTASVWQVREPLYQSSSGRWRNYAHSLEPLIAQFADTPP